MFLRKRLSELFFFALSCQLFAQSHSTSNPAEYVYAKVDSVALKAYIFFPKQDGTNKTNPAVVIFHGGGWAMGEPSWAFGRAQHFADLGLIAIAAQYRLSNQKNVTPLEAMADARAVIKWLRANANSLRVDPARIAAYGWSAGAHLAASAAIFNDSRSAPNALLLVSPAVALAKDNWFQKLLLNRAEASSLSPDQNVREGLPPTLILQGRHDTVTPLAGVQAFADKMLAAGNRCELVIFNGVGHLFTPAPEPDHGWPKPDLKIQAEAFAKADAFLKTIGYVK